MYFNMSYKYCQIKIKGSKVPFLTDVRIPQNFFHKAKGLLGVKSLNEKSGMLFKNCNSIHMIGMRTPLDVIFLTKDSVVRKIYENLQPWKIAYCFGSHLTLEMPVGSIQKVGIKPDMKLEIIE